MATALHDTSLIEHHDQVGAFDGRQAMRDDNGGSPLDQGIQRA
jgi:hypothetical protein